MVICLEQSADLHMAQLMPLPLTLCCFSKIDIGFTFLYWLTQVVLERAINRVCVCVCVCCRDRHCAKSDDSQVTDCHVKCQHSVVFALFRSVLFVRGEND